jgi:hypothetical protein
MKDSIQDRPEQQIHQSGGYNPYQGWLMPTSWKAALERIYGQQGNGIFHNTLFLKGFYK